MYISLYDLGLFVLFAVLLVGGIYLIAVLRRVLCMLELVNGLVSAHQGEIRTTVTLLQETLTNINALTVSLKEATVQTTSAVRALPSEITDTVDDLRESFETFVFYARIAGEVVKAIFSK